MEKIRELSSLLESGIEDYDTQMKMLQAERLKYIRLSITDGFGSEEGDSQQSWLLHLKQLEDSLTLRLNSMRQAIREAAGRYPEGGKHIMSRKYLQCILLLIWLFAVWTVAAQEMNTTEIIEEAIQYQNLGLAYLERIATFKGG